MMTDECRAGFEYSTGADTSWTCQPSKFPALGIEKGGFASQVQWPNHNVTLSIARSFYLRAGYLSLPQATGGESSKDVPTTKRNTTANWLWICFWEQVKPLRECLLPQWMDQSLTCHGRQASTITNWTCSQLVWGFWRLTNPCQVL